MVALTTPARRAISDMLLSGSLASASRAASRMAATLRSASARRRLGADAGGRCRFRHRQWLGIGLGLSRIFGTKWRARGSTARATRLATPARRPAATKACAIPDAACGPATAPPGRDRGEDRDPDGAADLVPGRVEARDHPGLLFAGAGEDGDRNGDDGDAEPESCDEHSRQHVTDVGAVLADVSEQGHPGGCDQEGAGERAADAVLADDVAGCVRADACRERERMKARPVESGPSRARSAGRAS